LVPTIEAIAQIDSSNEIIFDFVFVYI